jgi:hypothetical protein
LGLLSGASIAVKYAMGSCSMLWGPSPPFLAPRRAPVRARFTSLRRRWPGGTARRAMWAGSGRGSSAGSGGGWWGPTALLARERFFSAVFGWAHGRCGIPLCGASLALPRCGLVGFRFRRALWHTGDLAHRRFGDTRFRQSFVFGGLWYVGTRFWGCLGHSSAYILGSSVCCSFWVGAYCCTFCYTVWAVQYAAESRGYRAMLWHTP